MVKMPPSRHNTSNGSSEPSNRTTRGAGGQGPLAPRQRIADEAFGVLLIGSDRTIVEPIIGLQERRSIRQHIHSSYAMPTEAVLARIHFVFGYDLDDSRRVDQLRHCAAYQRKHGGIKTIYAFLLPKEVDIAERVEAFGAEVVGIPKFDFEDRRRSIP